MEYYSAFKKKEILSFVTTWMNLEGVMPSGKSQTEKCHVISLIYGIFIKKKKRLNKRSRVEN